MTNITEDIKYIGVNDREIDLFEGQYEVPNGMAYNSYVILDEKVAVMDTVDRHFTAEWLKNLESALAGRQPDYLIVQHMEPDHSAGIAEFSAAYPDAVIVGNDKTFTMIKNFYGGDFIKNSLSVKNGDTLSLGEHELDFVFAPMVHWPE
ncbi:MAG: FprA family A-type flavoprotein, partial [Acutalibacteraceae bacterium]|nr:FprA family A-type flavoprotein [Acutalibacteraceae bacterium]